MKHRPPKKTTLNLCTAVLGTVTSWMRNRGMLADQFPDTPEGQKQLRERIAIARRHGYNPSPNDVYDGGLAQFPGDPRGFVPPSDPVGHMKRVCSEVGVGHKNDLVDIPAPPADPGPDKRLADDLVQEEVQKRIALDPGLADRDQRQLREEIAEHHGH